MRLKIRFFFWTTFLAVVFGSVTSTPTHASEVRNGVVCRDAGKVVTSKSGKYRCAQNPFLMSTRLTWTSSACLTANRLLKNARNEYESWKDLAKLAGAEGEQTLEQLKSSIEGLEFEMKNNVCKRGR
jgi:hypothetical protein